MRRLVITLALVLLVPAATASAAPKPFGMDCPPLDGVRFCQGKVATFDGVPLDVNVTLPASGDGPFPLILLAHGWGGERFPLKASDPSNPSGGSLPWAQRGYAVLSITSRGFNGSCGTPPNRTSMACARGWIRLDDTRYEVRDQQHLAGMLVDQAIVDPKRIGVHGGSYGGGVSNALALLRNRVMNPDGTYAPWRSPTSGVPMQLAAAAPYIPWTDLVYSLTPNGRFLDYTVPKPDDSRKPAGVMKQSFVSGLFALGQTSGFYAPPGADPDADLTNWYTRISAGEPYDGEPLITDIGNEIYDHHSSVSIDRSVEPAPIFIANGWTDDLFPVDEAIRLYNIMRAQWPQVPFAMMHFDTGHQRGRNKPADMARYRAKVMAWMDRYVKGDESAPAPTGVETLTQTCPETAPSGGPYNAPTWDALSPGEVTFKDAAEKSVTNGGGDPNVARAVDPVGGGGNGCATTSGADEQGTVNYRLPAADARGFTLMGAPTVLADITATGAFPQLVSRLWDVGPDGNQTLVARGVYRPDATGRQVFQLHPGGWRFAQGHVAKLQLLGRDVPYARASNGAFSVAVKNLELRLPVLETPLPSGPVREPQGVFLPRGATPAPGIRVARSARRLRLKLRLSCRRRGSLARIMGADSRRVRRVTIARSGMRSRRDASRPFAVRLRGRGRLVRATVVMRDGRTVRLRARLKRRCR